jgi:hypothetical protein
MGRTNRKFKTLYTCVMKWQNTCKNQRLDTPIHMYLGHFFGFSLFCVPRAGRLCKINKRKSLYLFMEISFNYIVNAKALLCSSLIKSLFSYYFTFCWIFLYKWNISTFCFVSRSYNMQKQFYFFLQLVCFVFVLIWPGWRVGFTTTNWRKHREKTRNGLILHVL